MSPVPHSGWATQRRLVPRGTPIMQPTQAGTPIAPQMGTPIAMGGRPIADLSAGTPIPSSEAIPGSTFDALGPAGAVLRSLYGNLTPPQATPLPSVDTAPHGFLENIGAAMGASPFSFTPNRDTSNLGSFGGGLLAGIGNALAGRGARQYVGRLASDESAQQGVAKSNTDARTEYEGMLKEARDQIGKAAATLATSKNQRVPVTAALAKQFVDSGAVTPEEAQQGMSDGWTAEEYERFSKQHDLIAKKTPEEEAFDRTMGEARAKKQLGIPLTNGNDATLTDDAVTMAARNYLITGQMPTLGSRSPQMRAGILNRAAELTSDPNVAANAAQYRSDAKSLSSMQVQADALTAAEQTARQNAERAAGLMRKLAQTGSPMLNGPIRSFDRKVLGDADTQAALAALQVARNEYAKIVSSPNLYGAMTDNARQEGAELMRDDITLPQLVKALSVLRLDAATRSGSLRTGINAINARMSAIGGAFGTPMPGPGGTPVPAVGTPIAPGAGTPIGGAKLTSDEQEIVDALQGRTRAQVQAWLNRQSPAALKKFNAKAVLSQFN